MQRCENLAIMRRFWPGRGPDLVCMEHAQDSQRVANAMGFSLFLEPIAYQAGGPIVLDFPPCCCTAGFSETVHIKYADG